YPEYRSKARKIALREIAEKIFVSIRSHSELIMTYENDEADYLLDETISLASSNFLSGHQKVDEWIDKRATQYYVLFKLDLSTYRANRKTYFESLETVVKLMQNEASDLFLQGEVARGASKLGESIKILNEEMNRLIEPEYSVLVQKWRLSSIYELEQQIDHIGFDLDRTYEFKATEKEPLVIEHFLVNKSSGIPLNGLETNLRVIQGDVFRYSFDHEHHEALSIYGMFPEKQVAIFQITAQLRLEDQVQKLLDPSVKTRFISQPIVVQFVPYALIFNGVSGGSEGESKNYSVIDQLRKITQDLGIREVTSSAADYHVYIERLGSIQMTRKGYYSGSVSIEMTITDPENNREVYQYMMPLREVKVDRPETAWAYAFDRSINSSDDFLVSFVTFLCAVSP
ncbi:MAG: hypothetical protein KI790_16055, partial [Cyclobacteriaceae bacterium]|nr:hypothetical protein [Cyclobacteriaceae bacterium HetDA_MAG_MS6]